LLMSNDFYDSLDILCNSFTNSILDLKTFDDYMEFISMGSKIKERLVSHTKEENTIFLLKVLHSIIGEQVLILNTFIQTAFMEK
jgi:hypothetical protein